MKALALLVLVFLLIDGELVRANAATQQKLVAHPSPNTLASLPHTTLLQSELHTSPRGPNDLTRSPPSSGDTLLGWGVRAGVVVLWLIVAVPSIRNIQAPQESRAVSHGKSYTASVWAFVLEILGGFLLSLAAYILYRIPRHELCDQDSPQPDCVRNWDGVYVHSVDDSSLAAMIDGGPVTVGLAGILVLAFALHTRADSFQAVSYDKSANTRFRLSLIASVLMLAMTAVPLALLPVLHSVLFFVMTIVMLIRMWIVGQRTIPMVAKESASVEAQAPEKRSPNGRVKKISPESHIMASTILPVLTTLPGTTVLALTLLQELAVHGLHIRVAEGMYDKPEYLLPYAQTSFLFWYFLTSFVQHKAVSRHIGKVHSVQTRLENESDPLVETARMVAQTPVNSSAKQRKLSRSRRYSIRADSTAQKTELSLGTHDESITEDTRLLELKAKADHRLNRATASRSERSLAYDEDSAERDAHLQRAV